MIKKFLVFLLIPLAISVAYAENTPSPTDNTKPIFVSVSSPIFTLHLSSNPTTGYSWMVKEYDAQFITVVKHVFIANKTSLAGAGGMDNWTFKVSQRAFAAPHVLAIKMLYARPWDLTDQSSLVSFSVVTK